MSNQTLNSVPKNGEFKPPPSRAILVREPVETSNPDGVDFGWVMQVTFVTTILVGAPVVALLSIPVTLESWGDRAAFAIRVGAVVWILTAISVFAYAKYTLEAEEGNDQDSSESSREE